MNGWDDALISRQSGFIIAELQKGLAKEREAQATALFKRELAAGRIRFALRGDDRDWTMPFEIAPALSETSPHLTAASGGPLERSLFLPIYAGEFNDEERSFAIYLDGEAAVRWWHRNDVGRGGYALRGWRRGKVYPDFIFAALRDGGRERVVVLETKGGHLAGNADTAYKTALLETLTAAVTSGDTGELGFRREPFDFAGAVVLFGDLEARLPSLIRGAPLATDDGGGRK